MFNSMIRIHYFCRAYTGLNTAVAMGGSNGAHPGTLEHQ
jgi:hypothetical protein